jgi:hypothetical protein
MKPLRALRKTLAVVGVALILAVGASLLPENPYQRWQLLNGTLQDPAHWIYERSVFDPTPIDVAFIGPSRIEEGVDAPRLAAALAARGTPATVVNFALPEEGRDLNAAVADLLLSHKRPKLLVIGVTERPVRFGHPAFKYLAPREMVAAPGYLANASYPPDLAYLPYRQLRLFAADILPGGLGLAKTFDPARYAGPSIETGGRKVMEDGSILVREAPGAPADQARCLRALKAGMHRTLLPARYDAIEFGDENHYVNEIADRARAQGVPTVFLAVPYYTGPTTLQEAGLYQRLGPIWNAGFLSPQAALYADCGHLDGAGSRLLTDWLADPIAAMLKTERTSR